MKIGELARITGCPVTRIRFYEQKGLLPMPSRTPGGQRKYSDKAIERLDFISTCRANGMKLECIERFIAFEKDPRPSSSSGTSEQPFPMRVSISNEVWEGVAFS